jgi:hypothetical protein
VKKRQQGRKFYLLQKEIVDLHERNKVQTQDGAEIREGRLRDAAKLFHLGGENAISMHASKLQKQDIEANVFAHAKRDKARESQTKSDKEKGEHRTQFAQEQRNQAREWEAMKREMTSGATERDGTGRDGTGRDETRRDETRRGDEEDPGRAVWLTIYDLRFTIYGLRLAACRLPLAAC